MNQTYFIYIITNAKQKPLYIGVTNDLKKRIYEHKYKVLEGFSSRYNLNILVYFENYYDVHYAIAREKQLKNWHRDWKLNLVKQINPHFKDLSRDWY